MPSWCSSAAHESKARQRQPGGMGRYGGRGGRVGGLGIYRKGWGWWGNEGKMELEWEMHKFTR
jgi:hypothetical protein